MRKGFASRMLTRTWYRMAKHRDNRIKHGMYMNLLVMQLLLIIAVVFFPIAGAVYSVCLLVPGSKVYRDAIALNVLDYAFLLGFIFVAETVMIVLVETLFFFVSLFQGKRKR